MTPTKTKRSIILKKKIAQIKSFAKISFSSMELAKISIWKETKS